MLAADVPDGVALVASDGEATRLLEAWTGAATAIVIDAVAGGAAAPGTLHRLDVTTDPDGIAGAVPDCERDQLTRPRGGLGRGTGQGAWADAAAG